MSFWGPILLVAIALALAVWFSRNIDPFDGL